MNNNRVNQLLQTALNATSNGVLITDNQLEDNPIIYVNAGFEQMTGYQTNDIIGHNCRFLQGEETNPADIARLREAIQKGEAIQLELVNYKKDGTRFWNDLSIAPVKNEKGKVTHFVGVQSDVTDRKEKEKAQKAQLMAENIVDTIREPMVILNEGFTIYSVNKAFYTTFNTTEEHTIGKHLYEIEGGYLNIPALKTLLENILPKKNPFENFEITHEFPRLGKKTLLLNARRLEKEEERPEYILLAMEDVTPFKQSQTALFESERHSRFIIDGLKNLAVITTDNTGNITSWNAGAKNVFGYEEAEVTGQKIHVLLSDEKEREVVEEELNSAIQEGQVQKERWMKTKSGEAIWALSLFSVLNNEAGNFQGFALLIHDQTPRKRLEEELAQRLEELANRDRAKDQFLAMLGHELRNPLGAISNAISVVQMLGTQENLKRPLEIADRQIEHMNQLVGDLLDVARVTQGKITLKQERLDLGEVVNSVVRNLQRLADAKKLEIDLKVEPRVYVNGDVLRLEQIVNNLMTNAIKYTDQGSITVELSRENENALFTVKDSGAGIDSQLLPRLFDLFSQADRTLARSEGGLGVGLTIVKQLVELHNGTIEVESEGKDKGSIFHVRLPLDSSIGAESERKSRANASTVRQLKILVVEDNRDVVETLLLVLQLWSYQTITAEDGESAVRLGIEEVPDVVLLDIGLPVVDGYQVAQKLREHFSSSKMKLIAMTGYAQQEDKEKAYEAGFDYHLPKPVDFALLKEVLTNYNSELKR